MNIKSNHPGTARFARYGYALVGFLMVCFWQTSPVGAQASVAIADSSTPVTLTTNSTGSASTYVLNADASVSVLQNAGLVAGGGCGPLLSGGVSVSQSAIVFDPSSSRLYAVIEADSSTGSGLGTMVTYASFAANGTCTAGPAVQVSTVGFSPVQIAVDSSQEIVYVLQATQGGSPDTLYVLSLPLFTTYNLLNPPPQVYLDYSATYGPLTLDSTTHRLYINDFGTSTNLPPGLNPSPGFFVYDPTNSLTVTNNLQHVFGYATSPTATVPLSAQALLVNSNSGDLILVNQNISISSGAGPTFQTTPFTILHTTAAGFSFFSNTLTGPPGISPSVYIQPGASGITVLGPASNASILGFSATGGADIDTAHGIIYRYAYDVTSSNSYSASLVQSTGALISYNLSTQKDTQLTNTAVPFANVYPQPNIVPWDQLTFDPQSDNVVLAAPGAVGVSSSLACSTVSVQQVLGGGTTYSTVGTPAVNFSSGYAYDIQTVYPNTALYYVAPPTSCVSSTLILSPSSLPPATAGQPYGPVAFSASGGTSQTGLAFGASGLPQGMAMSTSGSLGGAPTTIGPYEVTVTATDTEGDQGSEILPLQINCPTITVGPTPLPAAVQGVFYNVVFTSSGGIGGITFNAFGPFPSGISFNGTGLSGTPTVTGSFSVGIQATDANGCKSVNTIQNLNVAAPQFSMSPVSVHGAPNCPAPGPGFPTGLVPTVIINGVSYYQVNVNLFNSGNVAANANLTSAILWKIQDANPSAPGVGIFPIIFNNPGTILEPGGCVSLTFYYPTVAFTSVSVPGGFTEANVPQPLFMSGTFSALTSIGALNGTWSLTDRKVYLSSTLCCTGGSGGFLAQSSIPIQIPAVARRWAGIHKRSAASCKSYSTEFRTGGSHESKTHHAVLVGSRGGGFAGAAGERRHAQCHANDAGHHRSAGHDLGPVFRDHHQPDHRDGHDLSEQRPSEHILTTHECDGG